MSHLNDLATEVTDHDDAWATNRDRADGERTMHAATALARAADAIAARVAAELADARPAADTDQAQA